MLDWPRQANERGQARISRKQEQLYSKDQAGYVGSMVSRL